MIENEFVFVDAEGVSEVSSVLGLFLRKAFFEGVLECLFPHLNFLLIVAEPGGVSDTFSGKFLVQADFLLRSGYFAGAIEGIVLVFVVKNVVELLVDEGEVFDLVFP